MSRRTGIKAGSPGCRSSRRHHACERVALWFATKKLANRTWATTGLAAVWLAMACLPTTGSLAQFPQNARGDVAPRELSPSELRSGDVRFLERLPDLPALRSDGDRTAIQQTGYPNAGATYRSAPSAIVRLAERPMYPRTASTGDSASGAAASGSQAGSTARNEQSPRTQATETSAAPAPADGPRLLLSAKSITSIPFSIQGGGSPRPVRIRLLVRPDGNPDWVTVAETDNLSGTFQFGPAQDGRYALLSQAIYDNGLVWPQTPGPGTSVHPEIVLVVDTTPPDVQLRAEWTEPGLFNATWLVRDPQLDPASVRLGVRQAGQAVWNQIQPHPDEPMRVRPGVVEGVGGWGVSSDVTAFTLAIEASDTLGHRTVREIELIRPPSLATPSSPPTAPSSPSYGTDGSDQPRTSFDDGPGRPSSERASSERTPPPTAPALLDSDVGVSRQLPQSRPHPQDDESGRPVAAEQNDRNERTPVAPLAEPSPTLPASLTPSPAPSPTPAPTPSEAPLSTRTPAARSPVDAAADSRASAGSDAIRDSSGDVDRAGQAPESVRPVEEMTGSSGTSSLPDRVASWPDGAQPGGVRGSSGPTARPVSQSRDDASPVRTTVDPAPARPQTMPPDVPPVGPGRIDAPSLIPPFPDSSVSPSRVPVAPTTVAPPGPFMSSAQTAATDPRRPTADPTVSPGVAATRSEMAPSREAGPRTTEPERVASIFPDGFPFAAPPSLPFGPLWGGRTEDGAAASSTDRMNKPSTVPPPSTRGSASVDQFAPPPMLERGTARSDGPGSGRAAPPIGSSVGDPPGRAPGSTSRLNAQDDPYRRRANPPASTTERSEVAATDANYYGSSLHEPGKMSEGGQLTNVTASDRARADRWDGPDHAVSTNRPNDRDVRQPQLYGAAAERVRDPSEMAGSLPLGERPALTNKRRFDLEYDVDRVGPAGVKAVELWATRDGGQTWSRWGVDPDNRSPFPVEIDREGIYGFSIVIISASGLASPPPRSGDLADLWVQADWTPPEVRLLGAEYGDGDRLGQIQITWQASDLQLGGRPISLLFASDPSGPWTPIAVGLPNTGDYWWSVDPRATETIYVRVQAQDAAGNQTADTLRTPLSLRGISPRGHVRGLR